MIEKNTKFPDRQDLTPLEEAQAEANLFAVNMHVTLIIQDAVRTLEECETFLATTEGTDFESLRETVTEDRDRMLSKLCDMANAFESLYNISA